MHHRDFGDSVIHLNDLKPKKSYEEPSTPNFALLPPKPSQPRLLTPVLANKNKIVHGQVSGSKRKIKVTMFEVPKPCDSNSKSDQKSIEESKNRGPVV
jgi:hypothetical protein